MSLEDAEGQWKTIEVRSNPGDVFEAEGDLPTTIKTISQLPRTKNLVSHDVFLSDSSSWFRGLNFMHF